MKLNWIESVVISIILIACTISMVQSFLDYVAPLSIQEQRAQLAPTLEMYRVYGLVGDSK